jgi:hypothetical protein
MEFRLIYQGPLHGEKWDGKGRKGRATEKQALRKHFHKQLRELWKQHPDLREQAESRYWVGKTPHNQVSFPGPGVRQIVRVPASDPNPEAKTWLEHIADDHQCCGGRFVPLISETGGFTCALNILFLRRDGPGNLIANGGDVDNRIKVLLDGLRMPKTMSELGNLAIDQETENPFFCLLEDDALITSIAVNTDRLITPFQGGEHIHDVYLVIHVTVVNSSSVFAGGRLV